MLWPHGWSFAVLASITKAISKEDCGGKGNVWAFVFCLKCFLLHNGSSLFVSFLKLFQLYDKTCTFDFKFYRREHNWKCSPWLFWLIDALDSIKEKCGGLPIGVRWRFVASNWPGSPVAAAQLKPKGSDVALVTLAAKTKIKRHDFGISRHGIKSPFSIEDSWCKEMANWTN